LARPHDAAFADRGLAPRRSGFVHGEIDVVTTDAIDGSVHPAIVESKLDRLAPAAQVAQHECETQSRRERARGLVSTGPVETARNLVAGEQHGVNRVQRQDTLRAPARLLEQLSRHPVATERGWRNGDASSVRKQQMQHPVIGCRSRREGPKPVADAKPGEAKPLLLGLQVDLFRGQFLLELTLEVVEQVVPAHTGTLGSVGEYYAIYPQPHDGGVAKIAGLCFSVITPPVWGYTDRS
jgi:hypothetical protein